MHVIHAQEQTPAGFGSKYAIYLAGPTLRSRKCPNCGGHGEVYYIPGSIERPCRVCLADSTYRIKGWREDALAYLATRFDGNVYVPEFRDWRDWTAEDKANYERQVSWEIEMMDLADVLAFWIPRDKQRLPGMTTNVEYGYWLAYGASIVLGFPKDAPHCRYLASLAKRHNVPVHHKLEDVLDAALANT